MIICDFAQKSRSHCEPALWILYSHFSGFCIKKERPSKGPLCEKQLALLLAREVPPNRPRHDPMGRAGEGLDEDTEQVNLAVGAQNALSNVDDRGGTVDFPHPVRAVDDLVHPKVSFVINADKGVGNLLSPAGYGVETLVTSHMTEKVSRLPP